VIGNRESVKSAGVADLATDQFLRTTAGRSLITDYCLLITVHSLLVAHCAGMVIKGSFSSAPVSAIVNRNMMAVNARFVRQSRSSTQNQ
jgi:hypothetical protein